MDFSITYPTPFVEKTTVFDPIGLEAFADGVTRDTYVEQIGILIADFLPESATKMRCAAPRLRQILGIDSRDMAVSKGSGWSGEAIVRQLNGGAFLISGRLEGLNINPIVVLNPYCRPSRTQFCTAFSDLGEAIMLRFDTSGVVTVTGSTRPTVCNLNIVYM